MKQRKRYLAFFVAVIVVLSFTMPSMASDTEPAKAADAVSAKATPGKVNINTATEEELCTLKGIGSKYAQRIIEYRSNEGEFKTPEDITKVKGIGVKTFEANKDIIVVKDDK